MSAAEEKPTTLIVNTDGRLLSVWPISLANAKTAIKKLVNDRITPLEEWDHTYHSEWQGIRVPKVAMLRHYAHIMSEPKFCRRSVFLRDEWTCQYCGQPFKSEELTFDHVIPREKGGQTVWENILSACVECNKIKRNREANWSGRKGRISLDGRLRPLKAPYRPSNVELLRKGLKYLPPEIVETWRDWLYWQCELDH
jgi:5-methylcytosine-specific restriction endonuclease McrA